ncbi:unnamed protein product [Fusarium graminearum]|uniref:Helicase C-terminal domain-containing protein n=1 Tax=Gibberella zeae TaxID=5518 RepID=A0A4E9DM03_GIBZA|nr:unnamed protein product [Fusarium graminearum]
MEIGLLDDFEFTLASDHHPEGVILHTLGRFRKWESVVQQRQPARSIPKICYYDFDLLTTTATSELGHSTHGFAFEVTTPQLGTRKFDIKDAACFSSFLAGIKSEVATGKLNLGSPDLKAVLVPLDARVHLISDADNDASVEEQADGSGVDMRETGDSDAAKAQRSDPIIINDDDEEDDDEPRYTQIPPTSHDFQIVINDDDDDETAQQPIVREQDGILGHLRQQNLIKGEDVQAMAWTFNLGEPSEVTMETYWQVPARHLTKDETHRGDRCPFTRRLTIQCYCEKDSILEVLHRKIPTSYSFAVVPRSICSVWLTEYCKFVKDAFDGQDFPFYGQPVVHAYAWDNNQCFTALGSSPAATFHSFETILTMPKGTRSNPAIVRKWPFGGICMYDELVAQLSGSSEPQLSDRRPSLTLDQSISLIIISRQKLSRDVGGTGSNQTEIWIKEAGRKKTAQKVNVINGFPFDPSMIICDEAHTYKNPTSNIHRAMRGYFDRAGRDNSVRSPFAVFLSATPATVDPTDLASALRLIDRDPIRRGKTVKALETAKKRSSSTGSEDFVAAMAEACRCIETLMISRAGGSPMLEGGQRIPEPHPHPVLIERKFDTPQGVRQAVDEIVKKVRDEMKQRGLRIEPSSISEKMVTLRYADIMWKVGPVPGLQAVLEARSDFPYKDGSVERDVRMYDDPVQRQQSAYLQNLDTLTKDDGMFPEMAAIVRAASRGEILHRPDIVKADINPIHVVLFTQYPCNVAAAYVYLKENCSDVAEVACLLSDKTPTARAAELERLRAISTGRRVDEGGKSIIIITTFQLGGFGLNDFVFCNLMVQLGEPQTQASLIQAMGRIARRGQEKPTFRIHLLREGSESQELLRIRNENRVAVCGDRLKEMRLFDGLDLIIAST